MEDIGKIVSTDYATRGASSLPDVPEMTPSSLKRKFDEISIDVLIPKINEVIDRANDLKTIAEQTGQVSEDQITRWEAAAFLAATALQPADIVPFNVLTYNNAGNHNSIYRGKYLGGAVTAAQWSAIGSGTFEDLYIGDYWTINNVNWRIAAFDYWLHCGDTECTTHHIVIVPDTNLVAGCPINSTDVTTGAYVGSNFYTGANGNTGKSQCVTKINAVFGSAHILSHKEYLKNAVTNGYESGVAWYDSSIELMTEQMVFGGKIFGNVMSSTSIPASYTIDNAQLPLFVHDHSKICNRTLWWLRDVVSATSFAYVSSYGQVNYYSASYSVSGIRPTFAIKA